MAFEYDCKEGQSLMAELTIVQMKLETLKAKEAQPGIDFSTLGPRYTFDMKMEYGTAKNRVDAEKYDVVTLDYMDAMLKNYFQVKVPDESLKRIPQNRLIKVAEAGARLAFDQYAEKTYPEGKGDVKEQKPTHAVVLGYEFLINREAAVNANEKRRSGALRLEAASGEKEGVKGRPSLKDGWIVFEKGEEAYVLRAELK